MADAQQCNALQCNAENEKDVQIINSSYIHEFDVSKTHGQITKGSNQLA